ncbi:PAS domain-containing protein [uncultured Methylibium sp.]|uniref:sensor histidine kinase n=1 Tax=uncultured Methylibium sp. TaxID=381093 RepID=UPI0025E514B7|nr:PAS domain-containing protein [uncultured Methylibium sp.]
MKFSTLPLHWKLALVPAATALLVVTMVLALSDWLLGDHLEARAEQRVRQVASQLTDLMARAVDRRVAEVELLARSSDLAPTATPDTWRAALEARKARTPGYAWLGLTDAQGMVQAATGGLLEGKSIAHRPVYQQGRQHLFVGDVHPAVALAALLKVPPGSNAELLDIALPLHDADGGLRAVLTVHMSWQWFIDLRDEIVSRAESDAPLQTLLLSSAGVPLVGSLPDDDLRLLRAALEAELPGSRDATRPLHLGFAQGDRPVVAAALTLPPRGAQTFGWTLIAFQELDLVRRPVTALKRSALIGGLLLGAVFAALGYLLSQRLSRPYAGLLDAAARRFAEQPADGAGSLTAQLDALSEQLRGAPPPGAAARDGDALFARLLHDAQRLRSVMDHLPAAVYLTDAGGRILYWNRSAERLFGWSGTMVMGQRITDVLHSETLAARHDAPTTPEGDTDAPLSFDAETTHRDGHVVHGEWRLTEVRDAQGRPLGLLAQVRDTSVERALLRSQAALSALMEQEKLTTRRIAQALHDRLGQTLAAMRLSIDALAAPGGEARRGALTPRLAGLADDAMSEVRQVLIELRPPLLDEQGLAAALDNELSQRRRDLPDVDLLLDVPPGVAAQRWPADVEYAAFMVAREAINNAVAHARPVMVRVAVEGDADRLVVETDDDGCGLSDGLADGAPGHLGVVGMRERALAIGARLSIESAGIGQGTRVTLQWEAA